MKKNYKVIPPQQKYMELPKIYANFGSRPVVAYGCKMKNNTPMGGYVIAVLNGPEEETEGIKAYMKQLKDRFAEKEPICLICIREDAIIYNSGGEDVKTLPEITEKKPSKAQRTVEGIPDELLAKALASALISGKSPQGPSPGHDNPDEDHSH